MKKKARGNVIVVNHDKSCNLVFLRPKSDIHEYGYFTLEKLDPIIHARNHLDSPKIESNCKKFGPIFVKKMSGQNR